MTTIQNRISRVGIGRRSLLALIGPLLAATLWTNDQARAEYPERPIRLVVPFPAGGPNDIVARVVAQRMQAILGQNIVIENRGGAGGVVGTDAVAKAAPDGYTIAVTSAGALAVSPHLGVKVPYDTLKDLAPITLVVTVPELLVASPKLGVSSVEGLVAMAKARPGALNYASGGIGTMPHLAGEMLKGSAGINIVHVAYRGSAPAVNDLLGGQIELLFADLPLLVPHVQAGTLKALATASIKRSAALPDVPTLTEFGFKDVNADNWYGMVGPAGLPSSVVAKLNAAALDAMRAPEVKEKLAEQGADVAGGTPDAFATFIRSESAKWAKIIQAAGIRAE